jgi:hypothetical protein
VVRSGSEGPGPPERARAAAVGEPSRPVRSGAAAPWGAVHRFVLRAIECRVTLVRVCQAVDLSHVVNSNEHAGSATSRRRYWSPWPARPDKDVIPKTGRASSKIGMTICQVSVRFSTFSGAFPPPIQRLCARDAPIDALRRPVA